MILQSPLPEHVISALLNSFRSEVSIISVYPEIDHIERDNVETKVKDDILGESDDSEKE